MRKLFFIILVLFPCLLFAQTKEIKAARANIKKSVNLEAAEKSMRELLKDSANMNNEKVWLTLFDAVKKQYEQLNEKLYLKQQSDTAKFFTHTLHMFSTLESLDSIDANPQLSGKPVPQYRSKHASYLNKYRSNLFTAGAFFIKKEKYEDAFVYFDTYVDCVFQPLFANYSYVKKDKFLPEAAYWAVYCGYKCKDADKALKYYELARLDQAHEVYLLQYLAEAYLMKRDFTHYRETLEEGLAKYPDVPYYFIHLSIYLNRNEQYEEVKKMSLKALEDDPNFQPALLALSTAQLNLQEYDDCVVTIDKLLAQANDMPMPYYNAGMCYYNMAMAIPKADLLKPSGKQKQKDLFSRARPYLEKFRTMVPQAKDRWAQPLYDIYLNLNIGDGFEEMEEILSKDE